MLVMIGIIALILFLDLLLSFFEKKECKNRLKRDNANLINIVRKKNTKIRKLKNKIKRLENRIQIGDWSVDSEIERRCFYLESENAKLKSEIKVKNALLDGATKMRKRGGSNDQ